MRGPATLTSGTDHGSSTRSQSGKLRVRRNDLRIDRATGRACLTTEAIHASSAAMASMAVSGTPSANQSAVLMMSSLIDAHTRMSTMRRINT
jgi:hypothetical protein